VAGQFPCDGSVASENDTYDEDATITVDVMRRFESENFRFVGKLQPDRFLQPDFSRYDNMTAENGTFKSTDAAYTYVRVTKEGHQYTARVDPSKLPEASASEPFPGLYLLKDAGSNRYLQRALAVIGKDNRVLVRDTKLFPYRAIGEADFGSQDGGCTVTMVARNAAITAGHCVYDESRGQYLALNSVGLGRYHLDNARASPFGVWTVDTRTTTAEYLQSGSENYDIAVITFVPQTRNDCDHTYPGDVVGWLGMDRAHRSSTGLDYRLSRAIIAGYPADKAAGQMWKSGPCEWEVADVPQFGYHYCDTMPGNSGSAVIVSGNTILGVHAYGYKGFNGAILMEGNLFDTVYSWTGLDTQLPSCDVGSGNGGGDQGCPCKAFHSKLLKIICGMLFYQQCFGV